MNETRSVNRGYEEYAFINGRELSDQLISQLRANLMAPNEVAEVTKGSTMFTFHLTEFEEEMLYASFTRKNCTIFVLLTR